MKGRVNGRCDQKTPDCSSVDESYLCMKGHTDNLSHHLLSPFPLTAEPYSQRLSHLQTCQRLLYTKNGDYLLPFLISNYGVHKQCWI